MTLEERKAALMKQIYDINDEHALIILQENLVDYAQTSKDPSAELLPEQLAELVTLIQEPSDKDTISLDAFKNGLNKWRTKS